MTSRKPLNLNALGKNLRDATVLINSPTLAGLINSNKLTQAAKIGLERLEEGKPLTKSEAHALVNALNTQNLTPSQQSAVLQALNVNQAIVAQNKPGKNPNGKFPNGGGGSGGGGSGGGGSGGYSGGGSGGGDFGGDNGEAVVDGGAMAPAMDGGVAMAAPEVAMAPAVAATADEDEVYGCQITELVEGPAHSAGLAVGDIILGIGNTPTPDFDSLRTALASASGATDATFINKDNGQVERIPLEPVDGKLGITIEEARVR